LAFIVALVLALLIPGTETRAEGGPLGLEECLSIAGKNNAEIKVALEKVKESEAVYRGKLGFLLPQVDANLSYYRYNEQLPAKKQRFGESLDDYYAEMVMKLPLFQGGKDWGQIRAAKNNLDAEKQRLEQVKRSVFASVKKAYYERVRSVVDLGIQKDLLKGLEEQSSIAKLLYAGGKFSAIDVLKIETQAAVSRDVLKNMENTMRIRSLALGRALGSDKPVETVQDVADIDTRIGIRRNCIAEGFKGNPDRLVAAFLLDKSRNDETTAESGHYPYLSFIGNYNWEDKKFFPGNSNWNVGAAVTVPIFHGGTVLAAVSEAKARSRQLEVKLDDIVKDLAVRFESSEATVTDSLNRLVTTRKVLSLAEDTYRTSLLRYKSGKLSALELLDAQTVWYNARLGYKKNMIDCLIAMAEIEQICPNAVVFDRGDTK